MYVCNVQMSFCTQVNAVLICSGVKNYKNKKPFDLISFFFLIFSVFFSFNHQNIRMESDPRIVEKLVFWFFCVFVLSLLHILSCYLEYLNVILFIKKSINCISFTCFKLFFEIAGRNANFLWNRCLLFYLCRMHRINEYNMNLRKPLT